MHSTVSDSSAIATIHYDQDVKQLTIHFRNGGRYRYDGVTPEEHTAFIAAPSHGKHFGANISKKRAVKL